MAKLLRVRGAGWCVVDNDMYDQLARYRWGVNNWGYANRATYDNTKRCKVACVYLHRVILPGVKLVDHINRDKLDNRRTNLRPSDKSKNAINSKIPTTNRSGVKNVFFWNHRRQWVAKVDRNGRDILIGNFNNKQDAINALDAFLKREKANES